MLTGRLYGGMPRRSCPSSRMRPADGSSKPASILSRVDLPQPEAPSRAKNSRSKMVSDRLLTAVKSPNFLVTLSNWIYGLAFGSFHGAKSLRMLPSDFMIPTLRCFFKFPKRKRPRQLAAGVVSQCLLAGDDLGPGARDDALCLGVVWRDGIQLLRRLFVRIDRRI